MTQQKPIGFIVVQNNLIKRGCVSLAGEKIVHEIKTSP